MGAMKNAFTITIGISADKLAVRERASTAAIVPPMASSKRAWWRRVASASPPHSGALTSVTSGRMPDSSPIWLADSPTWA